MEGECVLGFRDPTPVKKCKIVFLGEQGVGKTSIISRYMYDTFAPLYQTTIGVDFLSKTINVEGSMVRLQLWDTAGQERFRALTPSYIRDCRAAVIVYDTDNKASFEKASEWIRDVVKVRGSEATLVLVGNKIDQKSKQVSSEMGKKRASEHNAFFVETSARTGENVVELFDHVATTFLGIMHKVEVKEESLVEIRLGPTSVGMVCPAQTNSRCSC